MDTIGVDTYPLIAPVTGTATAVITQQDPVLRRARAKGARGHCRFYSPPWSGKRRQTGLLRTSVRRAIIAVIAHLMPAQIAPPNRLRRPMP